MSFKLSYDMESALITIHATGGYAIPEGGGWWKDKQGNRLSHAPKGGSTAEFLQRPETVGTLTIYALEDRGLLERMNTCPWRHRDIFRLSKNGRHYFYSRRHKEGIE